MRAIYRELVGFVYNCRVKSVTVCLYLGRVALFLVGYAVRFVDEDWEWRARDVLVVKLDRYLVSSSLNKPDF